MSRKRNTLTTLAIKGVLYGLVGYTVTHAPEVPLPSPEAPELPEASGSPVSWPRFPPMDVRLPLISTIAKSALEKARVADSLESRDRIHQDALRRICAIAQAEPAVEGRTK